MAKAQEKNTMGLRSIGERTKKINGVLTFEGITGPGHLVQLRFRMNHSQIRVLVVDDQAIVRKGTIALLEDVDDIRVVGEAEDGRAAIQQAKSLQPDVILMDLVLPNVDGIEAIRQIHKTNPEIHILALTGFATDDRVLPAIRAGALGYFLKDANPASINRCDSADLARLAGPESRNYAACPSRNDPSGGYGAASGAADRA